ncbi:recombinase family protein [Paraburkholderia phenoliruptrix]|uniref:recombinase family protein n=1 Tax=Paraburkholderia phenoliruptrix TaxID=252970 RepID=UPI0001C02DB7|nr:recombinase family protein [Paraburkholderia phenoliruptrix]MDR6392233.1 DNA invertase Pin-like site-specific DNA recombinase [Paraburkholderia phenoliruptrix]
MAARSTVYSYVRFSDQKQAAGSSAERQAEYAARWAAERGMELDATLSLRDEGLSAFHQKHVKQGALGTFLRAVEDGRIPAGSVLVVEGLDRLSRAEPILAQAQLAQIVNAGITVVTASDGREYNRESLKAQPMDLVYSLLVMIRAHEESDTKSKRVKAAIRRQCQNWIAGTRRGVIRNGKDPHWTRLADGRFEIDPERAGAVRLAIEMFKQGHGAVRTVRTLTERGLSLSNDGNNNSTQLYKIIRNRALIGEKTLAVDGEEYRLEGYYPPLLNVDEFAELQHFADQRGRRKGKGEIPGIITGLGITYCGYCGTAVVAQNLMGRKRKENGHPQDGHRRLICVGYSHNQGCRVGGSCSVVPIERAVTRFCSDQINMTRLLEGDGGAGALAGRLSVSRQRAKELDAQITRITDAMLADIEAAPQAFARKARELETQLKECQKEIESLEHELALASSRSTPAAAEAWAALVSGVEALDYDARMKARQLVADTFSRIVVFRQGFELGNNDDSSIDLLLIAKHGNTRMLHIDRRTGEWKAAEDLDMSGLPSHSLPLPPGTEAI